jgi:probable phosphoglycerate mutase
MSKSDAVVLVLARHGETPFNADKRFCGRSDPPLSPRGQVQAEALAERWRGRVDAVVASPARRAVETARAIGEPATHEGLWELDQGELEGLEFAVALARHPEFFRRWRADPFAAQIPGGESLRAAVDRVRGALAEVAAARQSGERVLVVGHQMIFSGLSCVLSADAPTRWQAHTLPNAGWVELSIRGDDWTLGERSGGVAAALRGL